MKKHTLYMATRLTWGEYGSELYLILSKDKEVIQEMDSFELSEIQTVRYKSGTKEPIEAIQKRIFSDEDKATYLYKKMLENGGFVISGV